MTRPRPRRHDSRKPMNVVLLPRTAVGRKLLRSALPLVHDPNRRDGELPDGSSIYDTDYDELAYERDYDGWLESLYPLEDDHREGV